MPAGILASCQVAPPSCDTTTLLSVAAATISPLARTDKKLVLPMIGPPCHEAPPLSLMNRPCEVAAYHFLPATSIPPTWPVICPFTILMVAGAPFLELRETRARDAARVSFTT